MIISHGIKWICEREPYRIECPECNESNNYSFEICTSTFINIGTAYFQCLNCKCKWEIQRVEK